MMPANDIPITFWISAEQLAEFERFVRAMGGCRQRAFDKLLETLTYEPPAEAYCSCGSCDAGCCHCGAED
jgi:hypothetical protein